MKTDPWSTLKERFWKKVDKSPYRECWLWTGGLGKQGEGELALCLGGKKFSTNRLAFEFAYGSIPKGMTVRHSCGNKLCVRWEHLVLRPKGNTPVPLEVAFFDRVQKTDSCWLWIGNRCKAGYGTYCNKRGTSAVRAHRISWEIHFGSIPDGLCVLHKCDNPPCVNPAHLFLGDRKDNAIDKMNKGRALRGEDNGASILKWNQVHEIRKLRTEGKTQKSIADIFGLCRQHVADIVNGVIWKE